MSYEEIKKFIEDNFGKYRDEKTGQMIPPKYNLNDKIVFSGITLFIPLCPSIKVE